MRYCCFSKQFRHRIKKNYFKFSFLPHPLMEYIDNSNLLHSNGAGLRLFILFSTYNNSLLGYCVY